MKASVSPHPGAVTMAAYLKGRLRSEEAIALIDHLARCRECHMMATEAAFPRNAHYDRRQKRNSRYVLVLSAATAAMLVVGLSLRIHQRHNNPRALLAASSARNGRLVESRLADFPWSRLTVARRSTDGTLDRNQIKLRSDAVKVLEIVRPQASLEALHTSGVANLLLGNIEEAVIDLERAGRSSSDPQVWSDLAAARFAVAKRRGRPLVYPEALNAVDHALHLRPDLREAAFNRALILEEIGLTHQATAQWKAYLALDSASPWTQEATAHLRRLQHEAQENDFRSALATSSDAFAVGNSAPLDDLVHRSPQDARTWGEGPLLAQWAAAVHRHDAAGAQRILDVVRRIAEQISALHGEQLLADSVAVIYAARDDPARLALLADGYALYDSGRSHAFTAPAAAERDLRQAATLFHRAGSPMQELAMSYAASMIFDQNRSAEARAIFLDLAARCDRRRHRALDALEASQLTRCEGFAGEWTAALQDSLRATQIFESLGENGNAAFLRTTVATAYDHMGDSERAWELFISSINGLRSERDSPRRRAALANAVRSCIRNRQYDGAIALAQAAIEDLRDPSAAQLLCDALIQRARAAAENGYDAAAMISEAQQAAAALADVAQRTRAEADLTIVQGIAARHTNPVTSVVLLSGAIDFYRARQFKPWLIEALFQRGRSYAAAARPASAIDDFQRAIEELEQQRTTIAEAPARERFFDLEPALFEDAIALQIRQRDVVGAFATADRARARTLREQIGGAPSAAWLPPRELQNALPPATAILEYALVPSGVAIFCLTPSSLSATTVPIDRTGLHDLITGFRAAIEHNEEPTVVNELGRRLHELLLAPTRAQLAGIAHVICVADRDLQSVPFAALVDGNTGQYVIQDRAVSFAPSASLAVYQSIRPVTGGTALILGNPTNPDGESLPAAESEAVALGRLYRDSLVLTRETVTKQQFLAEAPRARYIHFAGHARAEDRGPAALLLSSNSRDDGVLDAGEIARLRLPATSLVVIAACSTARGETRRMEGVPSLARAFMAAGANTVVATLWDIDDALTSPLFTTFHRAVAAGESPARALRQAQLAALSSSDPSERRPSTWGGIVLIGLGQ